MGEPGCLLGIGTGMGQRTDPAPPAFSLSSVLVTRRPCLLEGSTGDEEDHQGHQPQARFSGLRAGFVIILCVPIAPWNFGKMIHRWEFSSIIHSGVLAGH